MQRIFLVATAVLALFGIKVGAQTSVNPDISLIGDLRAFSHNDDSRPQEVEEWNLADPEVELFVTGYLNPYVRATATFGWHPEANAEIEEVYATVLRGLPLAMSLRAGKYRLEFGRLNPIHPHAYSFVKMPLVHRQFFGEEGLNDMAIRPSFLLPTGDAYTELMAAVLKGDALLGHGHDDEGHEDDGDSDDRPDPGFFGRLTSAVAVSEYAELSIGGSVTNAVYEIHEEELTGNIDQLRAWLIGGDIKYKHKPSRFTQLQIEGEGIARVEEQHDGDHLTSYGTYAYVDYRFRQKYNVGTIVEWLRRKHHEEIDGAEEIHNLDTWRVGLFAGFAPVEETSLLRLAGHYTEPDEADGFWEVSLQLVFSLGPHQPHNF